MSDWLAQANTSNRWKQTYIQGFVDISGGPLILRNTDASFNSNLSVAKNIIYSGVVLQKTATISTTTFTVGSPVYNTYNITTSASTTIILPAITDTLRGIILNFIKTTSSTINITFNSSTDQFMANGGTTTLSSFNLIPYKTSVSLLAGDGVWIEVGSSLGSDLSLNGNVVVGTNLTVQNGNLTVASGRTNLRDLSVAGNLTVSRNTTISGNVVAGNITTAGSVSITGGLYPYQPATSNPASSTGIFIGDTGIYRQASSAYTIAIGPRALQGSTTSGGVSNTGTNNIAIGSMALNSSTSGSFQVAIGTSAGQASETSTQSVFVGAYAGSAGFRTAASTNNVVLGHSAIGTGTGDYANISAIGAFSLTGVLNSALNTTAIGAYVGQNASSANNSTLVGYLAGQSMNADYGTAVGYLAGKNAQSAYFTAIGAQSGLNAGPYSTYLGSNTSGAYTNITAVGANAQALGSYEVVVGGDDGNTDGNMPLLTLPYKMKIGGAQIINTSTSTLQFRSEENVVLTVPSTITLPSPNSTRGWLNIGARFRIQKTFTGTATINPPPGQQIYYMGNSYTSYVSPAGEYHVSLLCIANTGNTWLAMNVQGVDLKTAQSIQAVKTFTVAPIFTNGANITSGLLSAQDISAANVNISGNLMVRGAYSYFTDVSSNGNLFVSGRITTTTLSSVGNVSVGGNLQVSGTAVIASDLTAANISANGNLTVSGVARIQGNTSIQGATSMQDLSAANISMSGNLWIGKNITSSTLPLTGNLQVAGFANIAGDLTAFNITSTQGNLIIGGSTSLSNVQASGNLTVAGFTRIQDASCAGNVFIGGNLSVAGRNATMSGTLVVIGNATVGNLSTAGSITVSGGFYPYQPLAAATTTDTSLFIGDIGQYRQASSTQNIAIGFSALRGSNVNTALNTGQNNIAIGQLSLQSATGSSSQIAIGYQSGKAAANGKQNVLIGTNAASAALQTSAAINNVVIGDSTLAISTGDFANTCVIGAGSLYSAAAASGTTVLGAQAGTSATSTNNSTIVGYLAGQNIASNNSTIIGFQAGSLSTNNNFTAIGNSAGQSAGLNSTYLGSGTGGTFMNSTAIGYNATTTANYEFVVGGDDGNANGDMPLLTLPGKMKLGATQTRNDTVVNLTFRSPENVIITGATTTVNLPTPDPTRGNLNIGTRFNLHKTFNGSVSVNASAGQQIYYGGNSVASYVFQANEYYASFLCTSNTGNTWVATNVQGVDLKSAQTISGGDKTFRSNIIISGNTSISGTAFFSNSVSFSANIIASGNIVVSPFGGTLSVGNILLNRSGPVITASGSIMPPYYQSYYINSTADISLNLPNISTSQFVGSEISFYKDPSATNFNVTLTPSGESVVAFGANVRANSYSFSSGKTFVKFIANNGMWFESGGATTAATIGLTVPSGGASIAGIYTGTSYTLNVAGSVIATSYNASSDRRLKTGIQPLTTQWNTILGIQPVSFRWKLDGKPEYGFIAQQVYEVFPDLRPKFENKHPLASNDEPVDICGNPIYYALDYSRMTPFLWQGMRELMERVKYLEDEVRTLRGSV